MEIHVVDLKLCFMPQNVFNADKSGTDNVLDIWFAAFLKTKLCLYSFELMVL